MAAGATGIPFDPYAVLGVPSWASSDEIHHAYRTLARQLHPDVNPRDPVAPARFAQLTEAFELLSDDARRRGYDLVRAVPHGPRAARTAPGPTGNVQVRGPGAVPAHKVRSSSAESVSREDPDPLAAIGTLLKVGAFFLVLMLLAIALVVIARPPA
jgi:curved DNA-binding protein CbpA